MTTSTPTSSHQPRNSCDLVRAGPVAARACGAPIARAQRRLPSSITPTCRGIRAGSRACGEPASRRAPYSRSARPIVRQNLPPSWMRATRPTASRQATPRMPASGASERRPDDGGPRTGDGGNQRWPQLLFGHGGRANRFATRSRAVKPRLRGLAARGHVPGRAGRRHRARRPRAGDAGRVTGGDLRVDRRPAVRRQRALPPRALVAERASAVLRRLDHANIFLIIAGTYTPFTPAAARPRRCPDPADAGLGRRAGRGRVPGALGRRATLAVHPVYIALGWAAAFWLPEFASRGGIAVLVLIMVGGLLYIGGRAWSTPSSGRTRRHGGSASTRSSTPDGRRLRRPHVGVSLAAFGVGAVAVG